MTNAPNLGPNPPGYCSKPWGLLDFQDIAIFKWPGLREFDLEEQCLILKHRNARLKDITLEELGELEKWIQDSRTVDVEGRKVNLWLWRKKLGPKELNKLVERMEEDLEQATIMKDYKPVAKKKVKATKQRIVAHAKKVEASKSRAKKKVDEGPKDGPRRRKRKVVVVEDSSDDDWEE